MKTGQVVIGVILILIALWLLFAVANPVMRWGGGIIIGVIGIWMAWKGANGGLMAKMSGPQPPTQPQ